MRRERLVMEKINYDLLFRCFVALNVNDPVLNQSTFSFNRERLFDDKIAQLSFEHTVSRKRMRELVSDEQFSVDRTPLEASAPHKSFRPKDAINPGGDDFYGQKRGDDSHASTTDLGAQFIRKGLVKKA